MENYVVQNSLNARCHFTNSRLVSIIYAWKLADILNPKFRLTLEFVCIVIKEWVERGVICLWYVHYTQRKGRNAETII